MAGIFSRVCEKRHLAATRHEGCMTGQCWCSAGWVTQVHRSSSLPPHSPGVWAQRAPGSQGTSKGFEGIKVSEQVWKRSTKEALEMKPCHFLDLSFTFKITLTAFNSSF